jgi:hypothetical protein
MKIDELQLFLTTPASDTLQSSAFTRFSFAHASYFFLLNLPTLDRICSIGVKVLP